MNRSLHLCPHCRFFRQPVRASAFALGGLYSGDQFASATRELADSDNDRQHEEMRFAEGLPFDSPPQFFPWCAHFTLTDDEIDELNRRLGAGDEQLAHAILDAELAIVDGNRGELVRLYRLCARANPGNDCAAFARRPPEARP